MLSSFPHVLRNYGLDVDVRLLLELYHTIEMGLVTNLGSLFDVGQHLIVKSRREVAPYTLAFWDYFLGVEVQGHRSVDEAIFRSAAFEQWYSQQLETGRVSPDIDPKSLIDQFLNEVLQSDLPANIQKELDARELLDKDNPDMPDRGQNLDGTPPPPPDSMVDYSKISMDELMERMRRVAEQQKTMHQGGSHWIGSHGVSPYGHSGHGLHGIRVGGPSYAGTARKVLGNPEYFPVDLDAPITDDNMDAALQSLAHMVERHSETRLDVERTVENTGKNAGILVPYFIRENTDETKVILLLDNGGNSMRSHAHKVQKLFSKIKRRFSHDLKTYYFHNTIYEQVYSDQARETAVSLHKLMEHSKDHKVIVVGDCYMGPHELLAPYGSIEYREESDTPSIDHLKNLSDHFPHMVWINPIPEQYWPHTLVPVIEKVMPVQPLSLNGIANAVRLMN